MSIQAQLCVITILAVNVLPISSAAAQQENPVGITLDTMPRHPRLVKPLRAVFESRYVRTVGSSVGASIVGVAAGLTVDQIYCQHHHGKDANDFFGPCTLYAGYGAGIGWFGGSLLGATSAAAHTAKKAGCRRDVAIGRAFAGALIGIAPGSIFAAQRTGRYAPPRSTFVLGAPLLSGVLAAAAVHGCES